MLKVATFQMQTIVHVKILLHHTTEAGQYYSHKYVAGEEANTVIFKVKQGVCITAKKMNKIANLLSKEKSKQTNKKNLKKKNTPLLRT